MVIERVSVAIKVGEQKREKKRGVGGGERHYGNQKVFGWHEIMVTENLLVTIQLGNKKLRLPCGGGN
jgi:hypothetical protein